MTVEAATLIGEDAFFQPKGLPVLGNLHQIARAGMVNTLLHVGRVSPDGIFKMRLGSRTSIFVTDADLVAELCNETRFRKVPGPALRIVRAFAGDGLFTAYSEEPNWGKAHRILMPAFSQRAMRGYFDVIQQVCDQLVAKWTRLAGTDIPVADDMTRLTLDSIALAGFGSRFNSFDKEELDSFLEALARGLIEARATVRRLPFQQRLARRARRQFASDITEMNRVVDAIVAERRQKPTDSRDLLNLMLSASDPETGQSLDDINIRYQALTFLVAGHETTSGLLTFTFFLLLRHPHVLAQAYAEVDRVLPRDMRPGYSDLAQLTVIERVIKESQRLWPTAPAFGLAPFEDEVIGGRWKISKNRSVSVFVPGLHRDPKAWKRPDDFDIDRWLPEAEAAHHPHAYKPFGNGIRACIGRQFALVEAKLAIATVLQRFAISDPAGYRLKLKETLTIKPDDFTMRVQLRQPHERIAIPAASVKAAMDGVDGTPVAGAGQELAVVYGTSLGTARDVAEEIAERARADGFNTSVHPLDGSLVRQSGDEDRLLVVVTATYNGRAPDSAVKTEQALDAGELDTMSLPNTRFAVLGIGNSDWPNYQAFPKRIDAALERAGAKRIISRHEADGKGDFDGAVTAFVQDLWAALGGIQPAAQAGPMLTLHMADRDTIRTAVLSADVLRLTVIESLEMVRPADGLWDFTREPPRPATKYLRLHLPDGAEYRTGDHLAVYGRNRADVVDGALARFGLHEDDQVTLEGPAARYRHLPLGRSVSARQLLSDFVELQAPMPRRALDVLAQHTQCPHSQQRIAALAADWDQVAFRRQTLLDLLESLPAVELPFSSFIEVSAAILPRFYSIASSPLVNPRDPSLIVGTIASPAWSGRGDYQGFASSHIRDLSPGDVVFGYARTPNPPFAPPFDPSKAMILIGPGTGFAPFRGFLEERAAQKAAGIEVGISLLFFGCRHPDHDWLCRDEVERWAAEGIVELQLAFSAIEGYPNRFVQDALYAHRERVWAGIEAGAAIYLCGDGRHMAPAVRDILIRIHGEQAGASHAASSQWLEQMIETERFRQDVFW